MKKECSNCHRRFIPTHKYLKILQKFCSERCRISQLSSVCLVCKKEFTWDKHGQQIRQYCSIKCSRLGSRNRLNMICIWCKKSFWIRASRLKYVNIRCCSKKCSNALRQSTKKSRSEILKKYNNKPEVKLKKQEYHFGGFYKEKLRDQAVKRDNFTCQICGSKKNLIVHHYDGDRLNNILSNLVTLCRECHPTVHGSWGIKLG